MYLCLRTHTPACVDTYNGRDNVVIGLGSAISFQGNEHGSFEL